MNSNLEKNPRDICERTFEFAVSITRLCQKLYAVAGVSRLLANQTLPKRHECGRECRGSASGTKQTGFHQQEWHLLERSTRNASLAATGFSGSTRPNR